MIGEARNSMLGTLHGLLRGVAPAILAVSVAACAQTKSYVHDQVPPRPAGGVEVLLLEPDIELSELSVPNRSCIRP